MNRTNLSSNIPLFYVYTLLNNFILDRAIWMLFLMSRGFTLSQVALVESAYHAMIFLFEVPTGYIADRYGKRVSLMVGQLVAAISSGMMLIGESEAAVVTGFLLGALASTFLSGATSSLVYETFKHLRKEGQFKRCNSQLTAVLLIALGLGGMAGGALSDVDWTWVYFGKVVLSLLSSAAIGLMKEPHSDGVLDGHEEGNRSFADQLRVAYLFARSCRSFLALGVTERLSTRCHGPLFSTVKCCFRNSVCKIKRSVW